MQSKRRANASLSTLPSFRDAAATQAPPGLELYAAVYKKVDHSRTLSSLSILTHFWVKTLAITPQCPLGPFKNLLDAVDRVTASCDRVAQPEGMTDVLGQVSSAVMNAGLQSNSKQGILPALAEDIAFASFRPCVSRNLFRRIRFLSPSLETVFEDGSNINVEAAREYFERVPFDVHMGLISAKHLEAFSHRIIEAIVKNGVGATNQPGSSDIEKDSMRSLVEFGLRKHRFFRLRLELTKHSGGRILRLPDTR